METNTPKKEWNVENHISLQFHFDLQHLQIVQLQKKEKKRQVTQGEERVKRDI